jgi:PAS domain S-box-containing protein
MHRRIPTGAGPDFLHRLLESMTDGVSLCSADGTIVYANAAEERMFGAGPDGLVGTPVSEQSAEPERDAAFWAEVDAAIRKTGEWRGAQRNRRRDGSVFGTVATIASVVFDGAPHRLCIRRDLTEERRMRRELADSQARLELATHAAEIGIWDWDLRTGRLVYSETAKAIFGFPAGAPVTLEQVRAVTHPDDLPRTSQMARRALDPKLREREPYEYRAVRPDGSVRWILAHGEAIFADSVSDKAIRYVGTVQDITGRKEVLQALEDSEARLRLALKAGKLAIWEYRAATDTIVSSPELNALLGFPADQVVSSDELRSRYAPGQREVLRDVALQALERGERTMQAEVRFLLPGGRELWMLIRADFLYAPGAAFPDCLGVVLDISEQKRAQEHLRLLVDELNHRVKNTLAVVQSISAQTLRAASSPADAHLRFEGRLQALARAHDILTAEFWHGAELGQVALAAVAPHAGRPGRRLQASGPAVMLEPRTALSLAMAFHELATNALKYGALSSPDGHVELSWSLRDEAEGPGGGARLDIVWRESGGPAVAAPSRKSFGSRLIERSLASEPGGRVAFDYRPEGLVCTLSAIVRSPASAKAEPGAAALAGSG